MSENKISSIKSGKTGSPTSVQNVMNAKVPLTLRRFWKFTQDTAKKFSRHLAKDRTNELTDSVIQEFRDV